MDIGDIVCIMDQWGEIPEEIKAVGDVYQIKTSLGNRCMKQATHNIDRVLFMMDAMNYVKNRGFALMASCIPARDGSMVVKYHNSYYFLQEWLDGREPDYKNENDMSLAAETIAQFHRASIGFFPGKGYQGKNKLGKWPKKLREKAGDLKNYLNTAQNTPEQTVFERKLINYGDWLLNHALESMERLSKSGYQDLVEEAQDWGTLVHGDTAARNFVLNKGKIYLIDFDSMAVDINVVDLWRLLRRTLRREQWDITLVERILSSYHRYVPLESKHREVLLAFLYFPEKPWRIVREYYEKTHREMWDENFLTEKFADYVDHHQEIDGFLKEFETII